ncbi:hypothetical protein [Paenibacillus camelliae]|uniref:hypothetical protein n=1 Tax=Paenibacillus camelliae TaxID=512410 RepID=UPI00203E1EB1|nr:hypothetical protein [Paenibacillus camelliae]MCM3632869.1 hypothetical protein [Paenibacillus camelliae]
MSQKEGLEVTMVFVDQDGNEIDETVDEVINGMDVNQQTKMKLLISEVVTGKKHIAGKRPPVK